jgi:hypothetical protein
VRFLRSASSWSGRTTNLLFRWFLDLAMNAPISRRPALPPSDVGDFARRAHPRQLMAYLGWCRANPRAAVARAVAASPRPAIIMPGGC